MRKASVSLVEAFLCKKICAGRERLPAEWVQEVSGDNE